MKLFLLKIVIRINNFICNLFAADDIRNNKSTNKFDTKTLVPSTYFKEKATLYHYNKDYKPDWLDIFEAGFIVPEVWYVKFKNCYLISKGLILNEKKKIFLESAFFQREYLNKLRVAHLLIKNKFFAPKIHLNLVIPLMNRLSNNYFHWTAENLTRIALLVKHNNSMIEKYTIVINDDAPVFVVDSLVNLIGWPKEKIIRIKQNEIAKVSDCIMISYPALRNKSTAMYYAYPPYIYQALNEFGFKNIYSKEIETPTHFIISRANAQGRNLINENEILNKFSEIPLTIVQLEKFNYVQQIRLFQNAKLIIAPHGAGLTNLTYCNKDAIGIELYPIGRNFNQTSMYYQISKAIALRFHILMVKPENVEEDMIATDDILSEIRNICKAYKLIATEEIYHA